MLTSLPPPTPQVEDDDPSGAGGTEEEFEAEVDQVWQLARLLSVRFSYNQRSMLCKSSSLVVSVGFCSGI